MRRKIGCVLSCVLLSALATAEPETPALLHLRFSDETGQPVRLQSAQILVLFSGGYSTVSLPVEESELTIPLTFAWLKQLDERICGDGSMMHQVLYFKADGYVSVQSNAFAWPETEEWNHGEPGEHNIEFMPGMRIDLAPGKELTLNVPFRKPAKRHLRFVDEQGVPMSGVKFSYGPFGFGTGRCGNLWTIEDYGTCETGVEGRAEIQDADVEYLFIIEQNRFSLWNPEPNASGDPFVNGLHMRLSDEETTVVMHRWTCVPLDIRVLRDGKPLGRAALCGCLEGCYCGACCGCLVAEADEEGHIVMSEFYPEEFRLVYLLDETNRDMVWEMETDEILKGRMPAVIDLPATADVAILPKEGKNEQQ